MRLAAGNARGSEPGLADRLLWAALVIAVSLAVRAKTARAQETGEDLKDVEVGVDTSSDVVRAEKNASGKAVAAAIRQAQQELRELEDRIAQESQELGSRISSTTREVFDLREREKKTLEEARKLQQEVVDVDRKIGEAEGEKRRLEDAIGGLRREIGSQRRDLEQRVKGSLLALEEPEIIQRIEGIDGEGKVGENLGRLLAVYEEILDRSRHASTFPVDLRLSSHRGKIEQVEALRLGLLSGYYSKPSSDEAGFLLSGDEGDGAFRGESGGLSAARRAQIDAVIDNPTSGGMLPMDITGGAGLAILQNTVSVARWFEMGGVFMWVLLAIAVVAVCLILERSVVLGIRSLGIQGRIERLLSLVEKGRLEEAERVCARGSDAVNGVLFAALTHRGKDRSIMEDAVQEALLHHAPKFQSRLGFIALCGAISPLTGLLGTVTGMILTFKMITTFGTADPRFMAGGISEALITTQGGLIVAIPCFLARGILGAVADNAMGKLETGAMSVVLAVLKQEERGGTGKKEGKQTIEVAT